MIIVTDTAIDAHQTGAVRIVVGGHSHQHRNGAAAVAAAAITIDVTDGKVAEAAAVVVVAAAVAAAIGCKTIDDTTIAIDTNAAGMAAAVAAAVAIEIDAIEAAAIAANGIFATATARDVQAEIIHVVDVIAGCQKKKRMTNQMVTIIRVDKVTIVQRVAAIRAARKVIGIQMWLVLVAAAVDTGTISIHSKRRHRPTIGRRPPAIRRSSSNGFNGNSKDH